MKPEDDYSALDNYQSEYSALDDYKSAKPEPKKGIVNDTLVALGKGVMQLPAAATGLADIPAGLAGMDRPISRATDIIGEKTGFQPSKWAKEADKDYSPQMQEAKENVNQAWEDPNTNGLDVVKAYAENPRSIYGTVVESLPSMAAGNAIGTGAKALGLTTSVPVASGIGEGAIMAGQAMDNIDKSVDPRKAALAATAIGVGGGIIGTQSGKLANKLGLPDPDQAIISQGAQGIGDAAVPMWKRVVGGAITEGPIEEGTQSALETGAQNYAEDKPITEGMARNVVEGSLAGAAMGGPVGILSRQPQIQPLPEQGQDQGVLPPPEQNAVPQGTLARAAAAAQTQTVSTEQPVVSTEQPEQVIPTVIPNEAQNTQGAQTDTTSVIDDQVPGTGEIDNTIRVENQPKEFTPIPPNIDPETGEELKPLLDKSVKNAEIKKAFKAESDPREIIDNDKAVGANAFIMSLVRKGRHTYDDAKQEFDNIYAAQNPKEEAVNDEKRTGTASAVDATELGGDAGTNVGIINNGIDTVPGQSINDGTTTNQSGGNDRGGDGRGLRGYDDQLPGQSSGNDDKQDLRDTGKLPDGELTDNEIKQDDKKTIPEQPKIDDALDESQPASGQNDSGTSGADSLNAESVLTSPVNPETQPQQENDNGEKTMQSSSPDEEGRSSSTDEEKGLLNPDDFDHLSSEGLPLKKIGDNIYKDHLGEEVKDEYARKAKPEEIQKAINDIQKTDTTASSAQQEAQGADQTAPGNSSIGGEQKADATGTVTGDQETTEADQQKIASVIANPDYAKSVNDYIENNRKDDWQNNNFKTKALRVGVKNHLLKLGFTPESAKQKADSIIEKLKTPSNNQQEYNVESQNAAKINPENKKDQGQKEQEVNSLRNTLTDHEKHVFNNQKDDVADAIAKEVIRVQKITDAARQKGKKTKITENRAKIAEKFGIKHEGWKPFDMAFGYGVIAASQEKMKLDGSRATHDQVKQAVIDYINKNLADSNDQKSKIQPILPNTGADTGGNAKNAAVATGAPAAGAGQQAQTRNLRGNPNPPTIKKLYEKERPIVGDKFVTPGGKGWSVESVSDKDTKGGMSPPQTEITIKSDISDRRLKIYTDKVWSKEPAQQSPSSTNNEHGEKVDNLTDKENLTVEQKVRVAQQRASSNDIPERRDANIYEKDIDSDITGKGKHNRLFVTSDPKTGMIEIREDYQGLPMSTEQDRMQVANNTYQRMHAKGKKLNLVNAFDNGSSVFYQYSIDDSKQNKKEIKQPSNTQTTETKDSSENSDLQSNKDQAKTTVKVGDTVELPNIKIKVLKYPGSQMPSGLPSIDVVTTHTTDGKGGWKENNPNIVKPKTLSVGEFIKLTGKYPETTLEKQPVEKTSESIHIEPDVSTKGEKTDTSAPKFGADNKTFTQEMADKARARMKAKMGQLNSGFDPELMLDGLTLAGFYIEGGYRRYADYARAMVNDLGEDIRPYLKHLYNSVRDYPGFDKKDMSSYTDLETSERRGVYPGEAWSHDGQEPRVVNNVNEHYISFDTPDKNGKYQESTNNFSVDKRRGRWKLVEHKKQDEAITQEPEKTENNTSEPSKEGVSLESKTNDVEKNNEHPGNGSDSEGVLEGSVPGTLSGNGKKGSTSSRSGSRSGANKAGNGGAKNSRTDGTGSVGGSEGAIPSEEAGRLLDQQLEKDLVGDDFVIDDNELGHGTYGERTVEESQSDTASYLEFMAETTGNPIFREKIRLEGEISELETDERRLGAQLSAANRTIANAEGDARTLENRVKQVKDALDDLGKGDTFSFNGETFKNDYDKVFRAEWQKYDDAKKPYNLALQEYALVRAEYDKAEKGNRGKAPAKPKEPEYPHYFTEAMQAKSEAARFITKLAESVKALEKEGDNLQFKVGDLQIDVELTIGKNIKEKYTGFYDKYGLTGFEITPAQIDNIVNIINKFSKKTYNEVLENREDRAKKQSEQVKIAKEFVANNKFTGAEELASKKARYEEVKAEVDNIEAVEAERRSQNENKYVKGDVFRFSSGTTRGMIEARNAKEQASEVKFSKTTASASRSTVANVKSWLPSRVNKLVESGNLRIVQSVDDLPASLFEAGVSQQNSLRSPSPLGAASSSVENSANTLLTGVNPNGNLLVTKSRVKQLNHFIDRIIPLESRSVPSPSDESGSDSRSSNSAKLSNIAHSDTFVEHGFSGLDIKSRRMVFEIMRSSINNGEIGNNIIQSVPINVMNFLGSKKITSEMLFHDKPVFKNVSSVNAESSISVRVNEAITELISSLAGVATKQVTRNGSLNPTGTGVKSVAASGTIDDRHDVIPNSNVMLGGKGADTSLSPSIISQMQGIEGLYNNGTIYLVADSINKNNVNAIVQHELYHYALNTDPKLKEAVNSFNDAMKERFLLAVGGKASPIENAAAKRVINAGTPFEDHLEEFAAYQITEWNRRPESFPAHVAKLIKDFIAAIRMALMRTGIAPSSITPADLNALAKQGAKVNQGSAKDTLGVQSKLKEIRSKIDAYTAFIQCLAA